MSDIISLLSVVFVHSMLSLNVGIVCSIFPYLPIVNSAEDKIYTTNCVCMEYTVFQFECAYVIMPSPFSMQVHIVLPLSVCPILSDECILVCFKIMDTSVYFNGICISCKYQST